MMRKDVIPGGLADARKPSDFPPVTLAEGIKVELEHTSDRDIATEIAMDHLVEDARYYEKLRQVEQKALSPEKQQVIEDARSTGFTVSQSGSSTQVYKPHGGRGSRGISNGIEIYSDGTAVQMGVDLGAARTLTSASQWRSVLGLPPKKSVEKVDAGPTRIEWDVKGRKVTVRQVYVNSGRVKRKETFDATDEDSAKNEAIGYVEFAKQNWKSKALVAVDLHGTLQGKDGEPEPNALEAMQELKNDGHEIGIFTCGPTDEAKTWLDQHGFPYDYVNEDIPTRDSNKPDADLIVDNSAIRYEGDWNRTLAEAYATGKLEKGLCMIKAGKPSIRYLTKKLAYAVSYGSRWWTGNGWSNYDEDAKLYYSQSGAKVAMKDAAEYEFDIEQVDDDEMAHKSLKAAYDVACAECNGNGCDHCGQTGRMQVADDKTIHKRLKGQPTTHGDDDERTRVWVLTTGDTDRDGETVDPEGGDFSEFALNSTIQWNHDTDGEPLGQMVGLPWNDHVGEGTKYPEILGPKRMALLGRVKFSKIGAKANEVWEKVKEGTIKAGSISFVPLGRAKQNSNGGNHYPSWKLLEFTICSVGSNPSAVATHKKCAKNADGTCKTATCACKKSVIVESALGDWIIVEGYEIIGRYPTRQEAVMAQRKFGKGKVHRVIKRVDTWFKDIKVGDKFNDGTGRTLVKLDEETGKEVGGQQELYAFNPSTWVEKLKHLKGTGSEAFTMGKDAWENDVPATANPFAADSNQSTDWEAGYAEAGKPPEGETPAMKQKGSGFSVGDKVTNQMSGKTGEVVQVLRDMGFDTLRVRTSTGVEEWPDSDTRKVKAAKMPHRKGTKMRQVWRNYRQKTAWLLKSEGDAVTTEVEEYVAERGLDNVRIEEGPPEDVLDKDDPTLTEWVEEEIAEPEHQQQAPPVQAAKTEDVADAVATRSEELIQCGVEEMDAVEASMEEQDVPKSMRRAVKALVARKRHNKGYNPGQRVGTPDGEGVVVMSRNGLTSVKLDSGKTVQERDTDIFSVGKSLNKASPEAITGYQEGQKDAFKFLEADEKEAAPMEAPPIETSVKRLRPGMICRNAKGNLVLVRTIRKSNVRVVKVNGDEVTEEEKNLSIKLKSEGINGPWGLPNKMDPAAWGLAAKLTNWYGTVANILKTNAPALKDVDLTGEEQKAVEEEVEEAFMKIAKELGMAEQQYEQQLDAAPGSTASDADESLNPMKSVNKASWRGLKNGVPVINSAGSANDAASFIEDKVGVHTLDWKFNSDHTQATAEHNGAKYEIRRTDSGKGLHLPAAQLKSYVKNADSWEHSKLAATVASRTWKLFKAINKDASPEECVEMMCKDEVIDEQEGIVAASAKSFKDKWQKKYGSCGKAACTKDFLCSKCVKKLKAKLKECKTDEMETVVEETEHGDLPKSKADDSELTVTSTAANVEGSPTNGGTDTLKHLLKRARRKAEGSGKSLDDDWEIYQSGNDWFAINGDGTQQRGPYRSEREAARVAKGTADTDMGRGSTQIDADVMEMGIDDDGLEAIACALEKREGNQSALAAAVYRATCAKV